MRKGAWSSLVVAIVTAVIAIVLIWFFHEKIFGFMKDTLIGGINGLIHAALCGIPGVFWC